MTQFIIYSSPGDPWYIGFKDKKGIERLLPSKRKRFYGHWRTANCPLNDANGNVVCVSDGFNEEIAPDQALDDFKKNFNSVEEYLGLLND